MNELERLRAENAALKAELQRVSKSRSVFGRRLKEARIMKGLSQKDLAEKLDISISNMSHFETGRAGQSFNRVIKVADILEVSLDWLCGRPDDERFNEPFKKVTSK